VPFVVSGALFAGINRSTGGLASWTDSLAGATSVALAEKVKKLEWVGVLGTGHQVEHRLKR
jgi:hypothetical protein